MLEESLRLDFDLTHDDTTEYQRYLLCESSYYDAARRQYRKGMLTLIPLTMLACAGLFSILSGGDWAMAAVGGVLGGLLSGLPTWSQSSPDGFARKSLESHKRSIDSGATLAEIGHVSIRLGDSVLETEFSALGWICSFEWRHMHSLVNTTDQMIILLRTDAGLPIPRRVFDTQQEADRFEAFILERIGKEPESQQPE